MIKYLKYLLLYFFCAAISAGIFITFVWFINDKAQQNYNEALKNPPSRAFVEEHLEPIFLTNGVIVLDIAQEEEYAFYTIAANGYYYRVSYKLQGVGLCGYSWEYQNFMPLKYVEE